MKPFRSVAILGVGLIGGSIGLALRQRGLADRVIGLGRQRARLDKARRRGAVDQTSTRWQESLAGVELVIVCTPVGCIVEHVLQLAPCCDPGTIITDGGSTKQVIVESLAGALPDGIHFVGSHPMAGSEKTGVEFANADLFEGRIAIVTRQQQTDRRALNTVQRLWEGIGSDVITMAPEAHDRAVGAVSHLPHLLASVLAAATSTHDRRLASTGWLDTTRIAAGDPNLWQQIFNENRDHVLESIDQFTAALEQFRAALCKDDQRTMKRVLKAGKSNRDALGS
jgi:prephenate dehydrogenase